MAKATRETILAAAEEVAAEAGPSALTLEAVAHRAGISKGGLTYNFPSKEALLRAMVTRIIDQSRTAHAAARQELPDGPTRELKAYILARLHHPIMHRKQEISLLAALAHNPEILVEAREARAAHIAAITPLGMNRDRVEAISLAVDGLLLAEIVGLIEPTVEEKRRLVEELLRMVDEAAAAAPGEAVTSSLSGLAAMGMAAEPAEPQTKGNRI